MFCSQCGAEVPANAAQCPSCQAVTAHEAMAPAAKSSKLMNIIAVVLLAIIIICVSSVIIGYSEYSWYSKLSQARACEANLQFIDGAKAQWALDNGKEDGAMVTWDDLVGSYLSKMPKCPAGGAYQLNPIGENPKCSFKAPDWGIPHSLEEEY